MAAVASDIVGENARAHEPPRPTEPTSSFTAVNGSGSPAPPVSSSNDAMRESAERSEPHQSFLDNRQEGSSSPAKSRQVKPDSRKGDLLPGGIPSPAAVPTSTPASAPIVAPAAPMTSTQAAEQSHSQSLKASQRQGPLEAARPHSMLNGPGPLNSQHAETAIMSPQKRKRSFSPEPDNVHAGVFQIVGPPPSPGSQRISSGMENGHARDRGPYSPRQSYLPPDVYQPPPHDGYSTHGHHTYPPPPSEHQTQDINPRHGRHALVANEYDASVDPSIESAGQKPYYGPDAQLAEVLQRENRNYENMPREQYGTPEDDDDQQYGDYGGGRGSQSGMDMDRKRRKRVFSNRTKTGCMTCRRRKKKCDELHPECNNCLRGGFVCEGYSVRQSWQKPSNAKAPVPLQSKTGFSGQGTPSRGPYLGPNRYPEGSPEYPGPPQQPTHGHRPSYDGGRRKEPINVDDDREQVYGRSSSPPQQKSQASWGKSSRPYSSNPPHASKYLEGEHRGSIYETQDSQDPNTMGPPPLNRSGSAQAQYSQPQHPPSHSKTPPDQTNVQAQAQAQAALTHPVSLRPLPSRRSESFTEREKMLKGMYYYPMSPALTEDRERCIAAIWRFNNATNPSHGASPEERSRLFKQILSLRPSQEPPLSNGEAPPTNFTIPFGSVGERVVVEAPFHCDYGYNITVGDDVLIGADCRISDTCSVTIGARCIFSPNVKLVCATYPIDPKRRMGSNGPALGRNIVIEEDCWIGANVTILAGVRVGKSSTVGAGSLLHQDVPPFTVVAGNPAKVSRGIYDGSNERH